ncbi:MAG: VOC family protein [Actinobacteria bacterium]|nr:MAG: VOC family protein [Actinomycetota bacterium]RPI22208.1 MAG: VOC family protein [Actinomycetota bacterium]
MIEGVFEMASLSDFPVHAVLPCSDYGRAKAWYAERLGLAVDIEEMPGHGWVRCGDGTWFILTTSAYAGTAQNTAAGFTVIGIESVMDDLRLRGVEFLEYDMGEMGKTDRGLLTVGGYKAAWMKDSEGNIIELSEVPAVPA